MIFTYNTVNDKLIATDEIKAGVWINLINPTESELQRVSRSTGINYDFLKDPLDDEEIPRMEVDDDQILMIISIPVIDKDSEVIYDTVPLGIAVNNDYIVTICLEDANLLQEISSSRTKSIATFKKTRFVFEIFHRKTYLFLKYLRDINERNTQIEGSLHRAMKNKGMILLLNLQKSLLYFSTALHSNDKVLQRLLRSKALKMYEEDEDLLEDVIIENRQAIEMADVYRSISASTMNSLASLISNNLNNVLKFLTAITIILAIPTMLASFWGMNVPVPLADNPLAFSWIVLTAIGTCLLCIWLLIKKDML